jgi:hypothetical protein
MSDTSTTTKQEKVIKGNTDQEKAGQGPADPSVASGETTSAPKRQKDAVPEGHVAPVQFAKEIDKHLGNPDGTTKPQIVYGYIKNSKDFPVHEREGFPKFTVKLDDGLAWIDAKNARKAERDAKKAAEAKAAAEAPAEG